MPANVEILISSNAQQAIQEAKKMQAEMDALKKALKDAGVSQSAYNQAVAQQQKAQASAGQATRSSISDLASLAAKYVSVGAAITAVVGFTKDAINTTMAYAREVRDLAMVSGTSAEEASRLLQVLDDFEVSAEDVTAATRMMTKQGLAPTIDTLASLSDRYLALNSAEEKNQFILDNLGRSGLQWVNVLNQGGGALRQMGAEVSNNLILTDDNIKATEEYRLAVDNMGDSADALKMTLAKDLLPTLQLAAEDVAELTDWVTQNYEAIKYWGNILMWVAQPLQKLGVLTGEWLRADSDSKSALIEQAKGQKDAGEMAEYAARMLEYETAKLGDNKSGLIDNTAAAEALAAANKAMTDANKSFLGTVMDVSSAQEKYNSGLADAKKQLEEGKIKTAEYEQKVADLEAQYNASTNKIIADLALMKMTSDGTFDDQEVANYINILQDLGLITGEAANKAREYMGVANGLVTSHAALASESATAAAQGQILGAMYEREGKQAALAVKKTDAVNDSFSNLADEGAAEATGAVHDVTLQLNQINGASADAYIDIWVRQHGHVPTGLGGSQGNGSSVSVGGGTANRAVGGKLNASGYTIVGEGAGGWSPTAEVIVGNTVIPHQAAQWMKNAGLLDGAGRAYFGMEDFIPSGTGSGGATPSTGLRIPNGAKLNGNVVRPTIGGGGSSTVASVSGVTAAALSVPSAGVTGAAAQAAYTYQMQQVQMQQVQQAAQQTGLLAEMNNSIKRLVGKTATATDIAKSSYEGASKFS